jgi:Ni/Co efflux regulator RcnB
MKKRIVVSALAAAILGSGVPAFAQDHGYRNNSEYARQQQAQQARSDRWQDHNAIERDPNWQDQRGNQRDSRWQDRQQRDRGARGGYGRTADFNSGYDGAGPNHDLRRGERLPSRYRTRQYVVDNYRMHRLSAPPRGYHWVQTGPDYVLVAAATGLIAQIVLSN